MLARFPDLFSNERTTYSEFQILFVGQIAKVVILLVVYCRNYPRPSSVLVPIVAHEDESHKTRRRARHQNGNLRWDVCWRILVLEGQRSNDIADAYKQLLIISKPVWKY